MEKKRFLELIWTDFVQVYTNINYSSLYSESLRENQKSIYYWVIYACFGLPSILSLIVKRYAIDKAECKDDVLEYLEKTGSCSYLLLDIYSCVKKARER